MAKRSVWRARIRGEFLGNLLAAAVIFAVAIAIATILWAYLSTLQTGPSPDGPAVHSTGDYLPNCTT
ncbi:MAG: hypothetical protein JWL97_3787 [Gemmatimonadales bacterium]|nr:hypothetical protein [Gemmatimonadales bacterium]